MKIPVTKLIVTTIAIKKPAEKWQVLRVACD